MLNNITIGQFFPGNSFIHRLDPRTKLLATIALIIIIFLANGFAGLFVTAAFILIAASSTGIHLKYLMRGLKPIFFIIIFTFVLNLFFNAEGDVLVKLGFIKITTGGLKMSAFMAIRLILLVMGSQLLTLTTSPISLTDGLESLMNPLKKIKFPAHEIAMMMSIALRFIPTLMEEADKIMKAQKARGANFEQGGLIQKAKNMVPLLVPLFVGAFRRADDLALAMEARCYRGGAGRTRMKQLKYKGVDLIAAFVLLSLLALIIVFNTLNVF